jgi:acyl carrier protein
MLDKQILERVIQVTGKVLGLEPSEIQPNANFIFDLGAESIQSVALVTAFEAEFGIEMDREEALAVQTVAGAAEFIGKYVKSK